MNASGDTMEIGGRAFRLGAVYLPLAAAPWTRPVRLVKAAGRSPRRVELEIDGRRLITSPELWARWVGEEIGRDAR